MSERLKILLIGGESAAVQTLRALAGTCHEIVAVMAPPVRASTGAVSLAALARDFGLQVWAPQYVKDPLFAGAIRAAGVDIILNVHSLHIIHDNVLRAARIGAFNMHPGRLPQYAGLNTVSWAIYNGEQQHGVTVHWMVPRVDAGDIAYQSVFPIEETDTPISLTHKCITSGVPLLMQLLETAFVNTSAIPRQPQDLTQRRYFGRDVPNGGRVQWSRTAHQIVNFVRACDYSPYVSPWGHPITNWRDQEISIITAARTRSPCDCTPGYILRCDPAGALVAAADEWVLVRHVEIGRRRLSPHPSLKSGHLLADAALRSDYGSTSA